MKLARFHMALQQISRAGWLVLCGAIIALGGCAVGPNYSRPTVTVPEAYAATNLWKLAEPRANLPKGNWWEIFGDPELNQLESNAATANQQLAAAVAAFGQARAFVDVQRSGFFPHVGLSPSYSRNRDSANRPVDGFPANL